MSGLGFPSARETWTYWRESSSEPQKSLGGCTIEERLAELGPLGPEMVQETSCMDG